MVTDTWLVTMVDRREFLVCDATEYDIRTAISNRSCLPAKNGSLINAAQIRDFKLARGIAARG